MKKNLTALLVFLCLFQIAESQPIDTLDCDKPDRDTIELESLPWFGNNAYLENFLDSIGYPAANSANRIVGPDRVRYHVPIKFWVYRTSAGTGGPNLRQLRQYIDNLNRFYNVDNNTWIGFYMRCEIGYINDDSHVSVESDSEARGLIQSNKERGCINIHIANTLSDGANGVHYRGRFFGIDGIFLSMATYINTSLAGTIAHEVGHYFELDHTHQYSTKGKCRKESVSRSRTWPFILFCPFGGGGPNSQRVCEATGDLLGDTPADPDLTNNRFNLTGNCLFNEQGDYTNTKDPWNDSYVNPPVGSSQPDIRNLLSYNRDRGCRNVFSRLQIAVMLYSIERGKSKNNKSAWKDARAEYDEYEMDNFSEAARNISFGEIQERNFHQQYIETGAVWTQCDIDWATFTPTCSATFNIETSAMPGRTNANTRLTLYNNALVQLAQNDNISAGNLYSRISWNFVAGQTYFIRIENMNNLVTGYYRLQAGIISLAGNADMCQPTTFTVTKPANANVTWSATPGGIVGFNPVGPTTNPSTTATRITNGNVVISATITGCGTPVSLTMPVSIGPPVVNISYSMSGSCVNGYQTWSLNATSSSTVSSWLWTVDNPSSGSWYIHYPNSPSTMVDVSGGGGISVTASNICGNTKTGVTIYSNCGFYIMASPNPATDNVTVSVDESKNVTDAKQKKVMIYQINVIDIFGNLRKQYKYAGVRNSVVSLSGLPGGTYTIQAFDGASWSEGLQVLKQ